MRLRLRSRVILLFACLMLSSGVARSQSQTKILQMLKRDNVSDVSDVQAELRKRNMTEGDARRMAKSYGMDYDTFISTYITGGKAQSETFRSSVPVQNMAQNQAAPQDTQAVKAEDKTVKAEEKTAKTEEKTVKAEEKAAKVDERAEAKTEGELQYFGYDIFKSTPAAFEPSDAGSIDPGYIISPGDELRLYLWGDVQLQYDLTVDHQGTIFIPTAGQMMVAGIRYSDLQKKMTNYLSKFYSGLASRPQKIFLDVSIAKIKPIKIFALGDVAHPGGYNISSFATVFNALYAVGGPTEKGSLRDVRVLRDNRVIAHVDIYGYLLKGQLLNDLRLQDNDVIFVPSRGKTVTIKGEVLKSAIYELRDGEGIKELIAFAGGLKATAYTGRVQVNRIKPFSQRGESGFEREIKDMNISGIMNRAGSDYPLYDGDILTIFPILDKVDNYVTINGSVYRPGTYELSKAPRLSDLVRHAYGLMPETYLGKADVIRTKLDESLEFFSVDLRKAMDGDSENDIRLKPRDEIKIYSIYELVDRKYVSISGYVKTPVTVQYADSLTLYDMVFRAGGLQDPFFRGKAFMLRADLIRVNPDGVTTRIIPFDLDSLFVARDYNQRLQPGDKIFIYNANVDRVTDKYITVEGEVRSPGKIDLSTNMTPMDAILRAGGFTEKSLRTEVEISRVRPGGYQGNQISENIKINLPFAFNKAERKLGNFYLQHKDVIIVRKNPLYEDQRSVAILGEVKYPGTYVLENRTESLLDLVKKAGGPSPEGYLYGADFKRNGKRLNVDLESLYNDEDKDLDVILHDQDTIYIPRTPNAVYVTGEVNNPSYVNFERGLSVSDYLNKAGGLTNDADYAILSSSNGNSRRVNFGWMRANPRVQDGSTITVTKVPPALPDTNKTDIGGTIKDMFAILTSAVTIIVLAKQIK